MKSCKVGIILFLSFTQLESNKVFSTMKHSNSSRVKEDVNNILKANTLDRQVARNESSDLTLWKVLNTTHFYNNYLEINTSPNETMFDYVDNYISDNVFENATNSINETVENFIEFKQFFNLTNLTENEESITDNDLGYGILSPTLTTSSDNGFKSSETKHHSGRFYDRVDIWPVKRISEVAGDLIVGGLMMVHEREDSVTCGPIMPQGGIQALETMLYTLDIINSDPNAPFLLGAHILDDCDKDTYGLEMAVDFIKGMDTFIFVNLSQSNDP